MKVRNVTVQKTKTNLTIQANSYGLNTCVFTQVWKAVKGVVCHRGSSFYSLVANAQKISFPTMCSLLRHSGAGGQLTSAPETPGRLTPTRTGGLGCLKDKWKYLKLDSEPDRQLMQQAKNSCDVASSCGTS